MVAGHMVVPQFRGPITYCVLQWCHPMLTGTQRRTSCSTRMITLFGDHVIKLDSGPRSKKQEISVATFGVHLFYDLFLQGWGACPLPPGSATRQIIV